MARASRVRRLISRIKALADTQALHPDKARLRRLWPAVQQATALYDNELDADHDGLYETYPWSNITGQEWGARFLYFHPFDKLHNYQRDWRPKNDADAANVADMIVLPMSLLKRPMSIRIRAITGFADSDRIEPMKSAVEKRSFGVTPITPGKT